MKCFEIGSSLTIKEDGNINRKHEMFWNSIKSQSKSFIGCINRKHEMFWNRWMACPPSVRLWLTVNMKCFEIGKIYEASASQMLLTVNMKCFEMQID